MQRQRDLLLIESTKKDKANFQKHVQRYFASDKDFIRGFPAALEGNIAQLRHEQALSDSTQNQDSQSQISGTNIDQHENIASVNANFLLIILQKDTTKPIIMNKPSITIGGKLESDVKLSYADDNQLTFTVRNNKLFMCESASARYEASIKIKSSILYKGASFKIGKNSQLFIKEVYDDRSIKLKIEPYMKESVTLARDGGTIGRSPKNKICIEDLSIGKIQAEIRCRNGIWVIKDLVRANDGIFRYLHNSSSLNKEKNSPEIEVRDEDIIKLESSGIEIHVENSD